MQSKSRLIMSDWAASGESVPKDRQALLQQLLILSLVYDEVLIQDETLVLNPLFAQNFASSADFRVIEQLVETGALVILKHPLALYPDDSMRERATDAPIETRATYISQYGTSGEHVFTPTDEQRIFYKRLDCSLLKEKSASRAVSGETIGGRDIMEVFSSLLYLVLNDHEGYGMWLQTAFAGITPEMQIEFLRAIEAPKRAVDRIQKQAGIVRAVSRSDGTPVFNRSLGYQLAATYGRHEAAAMQNLIQTVFAAPYGFREGATGRYSDCLHEFLAVPGKTGITVASSKEHVGIIANVATDIHLPSTDDAFCDVVREVRARDAGKKLRLAMQQIGSDRDFSDFEASWCELADTLASSYHSNSPIKIRSVLCSLGESLASATVAGAAEGCYHSVEMQSLISSGLWGVLGSGIVLGGRLIYKELQHDLKQQRLRQDIESALSIRCSDIAIPQAVLNCSSERQ